MDQATGECPTIAGWYPPTSPSQGNSQGKEAEKTSLSGDQVGIEVQAVAPRASQDAGNLSEHSGSGSLRGVGCMESGALRKASPASAMRKLAITSGSGSGKLKQALGAAMATEGREPKENDTETGSSSQNRSNEGDDEDEEEGDEGPRPCPADPSCWVIDRTIPPKEGYLIFVGFAIVVFWISLYTYVMVDGADRLGCIVKMPSVMMGLIILAAGTSVPDMVASMAVAREGHADMAAANAVGSNTFDILVGLGVPWLIKCLMIGGEIAVPAARLSESIAILAGALIFYLVILRWNGWLLDRKIGASMLVIYFGSIGFTLTRHYTHYRYLENE